MPFRRLARLSGFLGADILVKVTSRLVIRTSDRDHGPGRLVDCMFAQLAAAFCDTPTRRGRGAAALLLALSCAVPVILIYKSPLSGLVEDTLARFHFVQPQFEIVPVAVPCGTGSEKFMDGLKNTGVPQLVLVRMTGPLSFRNPQSP